MDFDSCEMAIKSGVGKFLNQNCFHRFRFAEKFPLMLLLTKGEFAGEDKFPSRKKKGQGRFWASASTSISQSRRRPRRT